MKEILEQATHTQHGPVLIADWIVVDHAVKAVIYTSEGLVKSCLINELSVPWHYDRDTGRMVYDFPDEAGSPET